MGREGLSPSGREEALQLDYVVIRTAFAESHVHLSLFQSSPTRAAFRDITHLTPRKSARRYRPPVDEESTFDRSDGPECQRSAVGPNLLRCWVHGPLGLDEELAVFPLGTVRVVLETVEECGGSAAVDAECLEFTPDSLRDSPDGSR
jgi:hypothetical protein